MSDIIRVNVVEDAPIGVQMEYTTNYNKLTNKPTINGVELVGNKTTQDLHIETGTENWELINTADFSETAANQVKFLKDSNGDNFSLKKFRFVFYLNSDTTISNGRIAYKDTDISNQYAVTNLYFGLAYGGTTPPAIIESVFQYEGLGTILLNACNTRSNLMPMANGRWATSSINYNQTAPFTVFTLFWGTDCTGKIELWGIKVNE